MPLTLRIFSRVADRKSLVDERVIDEERISFGRGQTCTVVLEDPSRHLSRLHGEFERTARGYLLRVVSGVLPVYVNGMAYPQGSEVAVHAGDTLAMEGYELEIVSVSVAKSPLAASAGRPAAAAAATRAPHRSAAAGQAAARSGAAPGVRGKWFAIAAVLVVLAAALAVVWPQARKLLPPGEEQKRAEQNIARLEGEARSMLKLVEGDRREVRETRAAAAREIERVEDRVRSSRSSEDRVAFEAALKEARRMSGIAGGLDDRVRELVEGPKGLPGAEGSLSAEAAALRGGDRSEATRLLGETVGSLAGIRSRIAEDRRKTQAELDTAREAMLAAETRAMAQAEARVRAEAEAKARAKARAEALEAQAAQAERAEQALQPAPAPSAACVATLAGTWTHPVGGTWTFAGDQGTLVAKAALYGARAQQTTVIRLSACDNGLMTYRIVRLALEHPDDAGLAYDRTPADTPALPVWTKTNTQRYAISDAGLRIANRTYTKR